MVVGLGVEVVVKTVRTLFNRTDGGRHVVTAVSACPLCSDILYWLGTYLEYIYYTYIYAAVTPTGPLTRDACDDGRVEVVMRGSVRGQRVRGPAVVFHQNGPSGHPVR